MGILRAPRMKRFYVRVSSGLGAQEAGVGSSCPQIFHWGSRRGSRGEKMYVTRGEEIS